MAATASKRPTPKRPTNLTDERITRRMQEARHQFQLLLEAPEGRPGLERVLAQHPDLAAHIVDRLGVDPSDDVLLFQQLTDMMALLDELMQRLDTLDDEQRYTLQQQSRWVIKNAPSLRKRDGRLAEQAAALVSDLSYLRIHTEEQADAELEPLVDMIDSLAPTSEKTWQSTGLSEVDRRRVITLTRVSHRAFCDAHDALATWLAEISLETPSDRVRRAIEEREHRLSIVRDAERAWSRRVQEMLPTVLANAHEECRQAYYRCVRTARIDRMLVEADDARATALAAGDERREPDPDDPYEHYRYTLSTGSQLDLIREQTTRLDEIAARAALSSAPVQQVDMTSQMTRPRRVDSLVEDQ